MMDMNKTMELAWELGKKLDEVSEDAYRQGYSNGIKDGNINNGTFSEKVNEAYNNGLNDAWEAARKVAKMTEREYCKIFERNFKLGVLGQIESTEAIQKLRENEKQKADTDEDKMREICKEVAENIEVKQDWIPVSERLPEEIGAYLVTFDYGEHWGRTTGQLYYHGELIKWADWNDAVIAWMPLPKPYEPQERSDKE